MTEPEPTRRHLPLTAVRMEDQLEQAHVRPPCDVDPATVASIAGFAAVAAQEWYDERCTARPAFPGGLEAMLYGVVHTAIASALAAGVVAVVPPPTDGGCPVLVEGGLGAVPPAMIWHPDRPYPAG